ncbi:MAG: hypothetical protein C4519_20000 [Desulfobacteraceae bacterium]|nr:MAG: hypothetical protein C4519_20000 [Desulfobacteraceae bacterium]
MINETLPARLADDIRRIYSADPSNAPQAIESHLKASLADYPTAEGRAAVQEVLKKFVPGDGHVPVADKQVLTRVFSLLLGRKVTPDDISSGEVIERLAQSLNTIFNALNRLISVINMTFSGGARQGEQTIRQFIGFHLGGEDQTQSLEAYLGRINDAFLITQEAFKKAGQTKVEQILQALEMDKRTERSSVLKIGPLRKAEDFDILKEKIERIRRWFDSGRFMEDYLREFEKNCQTLTP